jgi:hypothetical protein
MTPRTDDFLALQERRRRKQAMKRRRHSLLRVVEFLEINPRRVVLESVLKD